MKRRIVCGWIALVAIAAYGAAHAETPAAKSVEPTAKLSIAQCKPTDSRLRCLATAQRKCQTGGQAFKTDDDCCPGFACLTRASGKRICTASGPD